MKKYYYAAGQRIGMREGTNNPSFMLTDHLGSSSVIANTSGVRTAEMKYMPWGEDSWWSYGTLPTTVKYTGQRQTGVPGWAGLYFYGARHYDTYPPRVTPNTTQTPNSSSTEVEQE